jgi:hypothetical protein
MFQLAVVVAVILLLQAADDKSALGQIFNGFDKLVESTIGLHSSVFNVKSFTKSWLTSSFWIGYVYLACLLILFLVSVTIRAVVDFVGSDKKVDLIIQPYPSDLMRLYHQRQWRWP